MVEMMELISNIIGSLISILLIECIIIFGNSIYDEFHETHDCNCIEYDEGY